MSWDTSSSSSSSWRDQRDTTRPDAANTVVIPAELSTKLLTACHDGDMEACHMALLSLQQRYPDSVNPNSGRSHHYQPLYDLIGHALTISATQGHVEMVQFFVSSCIYSDVLRDGICGNPQFFPPFEATKKFELPCCVSSIRLVAYAALACIDQLAVRSVQFFIEAKVLHDFEAALCVALAMRRAIALTDSNTNSNSSKSGPFTAGVSPAAFHPTIVLLVKRYDFLVDNIRNFHKQFRPNDDKNPQAIDRLARVKALQASLLYEIALDTRW